MNNVTDTNTHDDEIDLVELFKTLWEGRRDIFIAGFGATLIAVVVTLMMANVYTAKVVLAPSADAKGGGGGGLAALAGQFGGLAAMAGVNLAGGGGVDMATLGIETLNSRAFLTDFVRRHKLEIPLFAAERWDHKAKRWIIDTDRYDEASGQWLKKDDDDEEAEPNDWDVYKQFKPMVNVNQDKKTQILTLTVEAESPEAVRDWANWLIRDLNQFIRNRDIQEAQRSIAYLNKQLESTSLAQMQAIIYQLIEDQTNTAMLAEVREDYAFRVIDPAVIPEEKSKPKRSLIVVMAGMLGGMAGCLWVFIRAYRRNAAQGSDISTR